MNMLSIPGVKRLTFILATLLGFVHVGVWCVLYVTLCLINERMLNAVWSTTVLSIVAVPLTLIVTLVVLKYVAYLVDRVSTRFLSAQR